ncbi:hypothetical protein BLNAU_19820 [Blattamonas nauphoetae]|uniref:Uncharacterized protein n=1 Tax=Blattamonas nauphoetae TaxID=2049346 RepID=A0ABQ9X0F9_9EUKA|nr:hypothetical protein BLNAU_19820 [Blattamonas nauphoetae]
MNKADSTIVHTVSRADYTLYWQNLATTQTRSQYKEFCKQRQKVEYIEEQRQIREEGSLRTSKATRTPTETKETRDRRRAIQNILEKLDKDLEDENERRESKTATPLPEQTETEDPASSS